MTIKNIFELAQRYNAVNYSIEGFENPNDTCEIIIDRCKNTIGIAHYDWDWGCLRDPVETISLDGHIYYIVIIDENNINNDTRLENYIKNNYGDDEDEDEDDGNPYDDEAVWIREFCEEDDYTDYELGYVGTQI